MPRNSDKSYASSTNYSSSLDSSADESSASESEEEQSPFSSLKCVEQAVEGKGGDLQPYHLPPVSR